MKGTIIAAMVAAAAAASAATIYALKKAHDKRLEAACNCDDLPEGGCTNDDECSCCDEPENKEDTENTAEAAGCCCADGICSIDSEDDEADQPTTVHMPEEEPADDAKPEQDDSADNAEKTIPISSIGLYYTDPVNLFRLPLILKIQKKIFLSYITRANFMMITSWKKLTDI